MTDVFTAHETLPVAVWISEPITTGNRGSITRWVEDHGHSVALPPEGPFNALLVQTRRKEDRVAKYGERIVLGPTDLDVIDHAHYKLWYRPIGETDGRD